MLAKTVDKGGRDWDLKEYGSELANQMSEAWNLARKSVEKAQKRRKRATIRKVDHLTSLLESVYFYLSLLRRLDSRENLYDHSTDHTGWWNEHYMYPTSGQTTTRAILYGNAVFETLS